MNDIGTAWRIARRELRGGLAGFRIFLLCLILGVGAIAAVGTVRGSIESGLRDQGARVLGGDAEIQFTYRFADQDELAWMQARADRISNVVEFRSMAIVGQGDQAQSALTQVKAVDDLYPLIGAVVLLPEMPLDQALAVQDGVAGVVMQKLLVDRLNLTVGDQVKLGANAFRLNAILVVEPDSATGGMGLGPHSLVSKSALEGSGLLAAGSMFEAKYRLELKPARSVKSQARAFKEKFAETGLRWRDKRNGAPAVARFVERIGSFFVIVGLAGLAVGGVGIYAAVQSYLRGKTAVIGTLKTLGASGGTIFMIYAFQIGVMTILGLFIGLALGALIPIGLAPLLAEILPLPADYSIQFKPLIEAAIYGSLSVILFSLWPLAKARDIRATALFRDGAEALKSWPRWPYLIAALLVLGVLVYAITWFAAVPKLALWAMVGIGASLVVLFIAAVGLRWIARRMAKSRFVRGKTALRLAFGAIGGPNSEAVPVVLSLGLGLTVLAAIGQIETNMNRSIAQGLPDVAPSYFFIDIQRDQIDGFLDRVRNDPNISRVDTAPMLRGVLTEINGIDAQTIAPDHWVIRGDRGITYAAEQPAKTPLIEGEWWPKDYAGLPLISFAYQEAQEIGLKLGDELTVNILGRDITGTIANFRDVDFSDISIDFVITFNAAALSGAPHMSIATVYMEETSEPQLLRDLLKSFPNITAIGIRDAIAQVSNALRAIAAATSLGALATLITGFVVLIGAAAAGERARAYEAAVLKTLGASRLTILISFVLRSAFMGAAAGLVALFAGTTAGWAVMTFVMETEFEFALPSAVIIIIGGALATVIAGLMFAWRPLAVRPVRILRGA